MSGYAHESATVEPGGFELDDFSEQVACPICKRQAERRYLELVEGGSLNAYSWTNCDHCGRQYGEVPDVYCWGRDDNEEAARRDLLETIARDAFHGCLPPAMRAWTFWQLDQWFDGWREHDDMVEDHYRILEVIACYGPAR